MRWRTLTAAAVLAVLVSNAALGKTGPSGVIRVLCIGESYYPETILPLIVVSDPKLEYNPLPANMYEGTFTFGGPDALRRFVRLYIPRRYEDFLSRYDLIILSDYPMLMLEAEHYRWFERAVREEAAGLAKYELHYQVGAGAYPMEHWEASAVYPVFPADVPELLIPVTGWLGQVGRPPDGVRVEKGNPLVDLPGVDRFMLFGAGVYGLEVPRPGAKTIAWFRYTDVDAIMTREYGLGRAAATVAGLDWMDNQAAQQWDFYPDFFLNQFYWLVGEEIPQDVFLTNAIRRGLRDMQIRTQLVLAVVAFTETFGASGRSIEMDLDQVSQLRSEAKDLYLKQDYSEARNTVERCLAIMTEIEQKAIKLKDQALLWVYVIEWAAVSGTALVCGLAIYALMVRRRMYREVSVTRLPPLA